MLQIIIKMGAGSSLNVSPFLPDYTTSHLSVSKQMLVGLAQSV
jgi:hypothetical protein